MNRWRQRQRQRRQRRREQSPPSQRQQRAHLERGAGRTVLRVSPLGLAAAQVRERPTLARRAFLTRWYLSLCSLVPSGCVAARCPLHTAHCTLHSLCPNIPRRCACPLNTVILPTRQPHPSANLPSAVCHLPSAICRPLAPYTLHTDHALPASPTRPLHHRRIRRHTLPVTPANPPLAPYPGRSRLHALAFTLSPPRSFARPHLSAQHCTPFLPWASSKNSRLVRRPAALLTPHSPLTPAKGLELYRLEQRYTRREKRSTFISDAQYVDGEYIYASDPLSPKTSSTGNSRRFSKMPSMPAVRIKELARVGTSRS
jgi:hypothetical protein